VVSELSILKEMSSHLRDFVVYFLELLIDRREIQFLVGPPTSATQGTEEPPLHNKLQ